MNSSFNNNLYEKILKNYKKIALKGNYLIIF
jgi:hypothetical protein